MQSSCCEGRPLCAAQSGQLGAATDMMQLSFCPSGLRVQSKSFQPAWLSAQVSHDTLCSSPLPDAPADVTCSSRTHQHELPLLDILAYQLLS